MLIAHDGKRARIVAAAGGYFHDGRGENLATVEVETPA